MGVFKLFSDGCSAVPNPDPHRFNIVSRLNYGRYAALIVRYLGCTSYAGYKILVTVDMPPEPKTLDPHFYPGGPVVARFPHTEEGAGAAIKYAEGLDKREK